MSEKSRNYIGKLKYFEGLDLATEYTNMAENDFLSAKFLENRAVYNQAAYFYMQYMEKKIKASISRIINPTLPYYANKLREIGHSLDKSIHFLIEILSGNDISLKLQLEHQILNVIFENIMFGHLYNQCRYPSYHENHRNYSMIEITAKDCERIRVIAKKLDKFLEDFHKL